jgi:hypothetical protein
VTLSRRGCYAIIACAVALAMGLSLRNGFVYDDLPAIVRNTRITDPGNWHSIPRAPYWLGTLWRPFTVAMYAVQWLLGHGAPWLFHLTSLLVYFAVGALLFELMVRLGIERATACAVATLFVVHPVHVEAVANSVGQAELWATLAIIGATLMYVKARATHAERTALVPLLLLVALGITSKEQGFTAPLLLGGAEWLLFANRGESWRARVRLLVPVTALAALLFVVRGILLNSSIGETPAVALRGLDATGRAVTFLGVVPEWARLIVWPWHLQADYGPPGIPVGGAITLRHLVGLLLVAGFVALFFRWRTRQPVAAFGLLFVAVALAPVSNLLTPTGIVMAERVLLLPTVGIAIVLAGSRPGRRGAEGDAAIRGPLHSQMTLAFIAIVATLFTIRSATRVGTWHSQERFFTAITVDAANAYRGWKVAAEYWDEQHDRPRAIADLKQSIALWPHDYEVFERLGQIYRQDGHCDQAIPIFQAGVDADADASTVRAKLVECLLTEKRWDEAERVANEGVAAGQEEFKPMVERVKRMREKNGT